MDDAIDVDDPDVLCTGIRHCVRIDRPPSPHSRKRTRDPVTISLIDSDSEDTKPTSSARQSSALPMDKCTELQRLTQLELASRSVHSTQTHTSGAIRMATNVVKNYNELKRKDRVPDVIEISSDSESETWPSKRQRVVEHVGSSGDTEDMPKLELETKLSRTEIHPPSPTDWFQLDDDDDDCIDFLASLDISNEANWAPLPERNRAEDLTPIHEPDNNLSKARTIPPFRVPRKKPPIDYRQLPFDWLSAGPWQVTARHRGIIKFPTPFCHARRQERLSPFRPPSLHYANGYTKLELTAKYPHLMSGSVNKIIQAQDSVIICAVVEGGLEDSDDDDAEDQPPPPPPENRSGSLVVYHRGRVHVEPAHCHPRRTSRGSVMKYYSIADVAFNPLDSRQFLSLGHDLAVRMWEILDPSDNDEPMGLNAIRCITFDARPQDLVYDPSSSALAITCYDGTVRLYTQDLFEDMIDNDSPAKKFRVAPKGSGHATGSTLWGKGPTKQFLFSSSEPTQKADSSGFHHAFDTHKGTLAVQFDATESGDAATLSPDGATLVLFTAGKDDAHPVRLYDVRRKSKLAHETEELDKFQVSPGCIGEVNQASFSPDGYLLAVARNDNALHIYDVRALPRGPLCRFKHHDSDAVGGEGFGIVAVDWIHGRERMGIVSGGNDGCVRLWEPALGSTSEVQGAIIGRTDFDVGHFSIGNPQNGELPLIIGDSGGGVHTYDFTNTDGVRI